MKTRTHAHTVLIPEAGMSTALAVIEGVTGLSCAVVTAAWAQWR
ncbi:hypothetical protein [Nocardia sp. NPDC058114]